MMIFASLPIALAIATIALSSGRSWLTSVIGSMFSPTRASNFSACRRVSLQFTKIPARRGSDRDRNKFSATDNCVARLKC